MRRTLPLICAVVSSFLFAICPTSATGQSYLQATGSPSFSVNIPVPNGYINMANGNLHLEIPLSTLKQRGDLALQEKLVYDSRIWEIVQYDHDYWWPLNVPNSDAGWRYVQGNETGTLSFGYVTSYSNECTDQYGNEGSQYSYSQSITWTDPSGTAHLFDALYTSFDDSCAQTYTTSVSTGYATDASGYQVSDDGNGNPVIKDVHGTQVYPTVADRYGNYWSSDGNGNLIDDLGRTPVLVSQNGSTTYYDVLAPNGPISNQGTRVRYIVTTEQLSPNTDFAQTGVVEYQNNGNPPGSDHPPITAIQSIQLPDGSSYQFQYDSYGAIQSMTLPTGGTVIFGWSNYTDSYQNVNHWVTSSTMNGATTTYTPSVVTQCSSGGTGCQEQVNVHRASGDETLYQFTLNNGAWDVNTTTYQGTASGGTVAEAVTTTYDFSQACINTQVCGGAQYITQSLETDSFGANFSKKTQTQYDSQTGRIQQINLWDYYTSSPPQNPTRAVGYVYQGYDLYNVSYSDGVGDSLSQESFVYSNTAAPTSGIIGHGASNAGGPYLQYIVKTNNDTPNGTVTSYYNYDDAGSLQSVQDFDGYLTSYKYDPTDTFVVETDKPSTTSQGTTYQHITKAAYDQNSGAVLSTDDENSVANGQRYTVRYSYEPTAGRLSNISYPDGGSVAYGYPSATEVDQTTAQTSSTSVVTASISDAYGRPYQTSSGGLSTERTYDGNGRLYTVTNPHASGASAPTDGTTTIYYDTFDRVTKVQNPDGTTRTTQYNGNTVTSIDERGNPTSHVYDAFGDLIEADEWSATSDEYLKTDYSVDALGRVTCILQLGANINLNGCSTPSSDANSPFRIRRFAYDSLSRVVAASIPEHSYQPSATFGQQNCGQLAGSGWTDCYTYDANGNLSSHKDNRGVTVSLLYDSNNRPTDQFSSTFHNSYIYDEGINGVGYLFQQSNNVNATSQYSYDVMGRVTGEGSCRPSTCGSGSYFTAVNYNQAGDLAAIQYPDGKWFGNCFDSLNRLSSIVGGTCTTPTTSTPYWSASSYAPPGELIGAQYGNGAQLQAGFNSRQSITSLAYENGSQTFFSKGYQWDLNAANLITETNQINSTQRSFGYDSMNRLTSASDSSVGLNQQYTLDTWGNLSQMGGTSGFSQSINNENQVSTFAYDAAGRLRNDGFLNYTYDDNGMLLTSSDGASYVYDGADQRAAVATNAGSTEYYYFGGRLMAQENLAANAWTDYIYAGGQKVAAVSTAVPLLHLHGYRDASNDSCGVEGPVNGVPAGLSGLTIAAGDRLEFDFMQTVPSGGGLALIFTDGTGTGAATDTATGTYLYGDSATNQWQHLSADLSQFAGETVSYALAGLHYWMPNGYFDMYYANAGVVHSNGSVTPIFVGQGAAVAGFSGNTCGGQQETSGTEMIAVSDPMVSTTYVLNDYLGSEVGTMSSSGMVLSTLDYGPYGQVLSGTSPDGFIFTGLQRDASGLDHATMRQYSSVTGRWTTPDPDDGSYDFSNPQSLNRYAYVGNMPLFATDPSGLAATPIVPCGNAFCMGVSTSGSCGDECQIAIDIATAGLYYLFSDLFESNPFHGNVTAQRAGKTVRTQNDCPTSAPSLSPHGVGVVGGAEATAGSGSGGTIQGSAGYGWFSSPTGGTNSGGFSSFVAAGRLGPWTAGNVPQGGEGSPLPLFAGGAVGTGVGLIVTNARNVSQLGGIFTSINLTTPWGSLNFSYGSGIWTGSMTVGPGAGAALSITKTPTKTGAVHDPCQ